MGNFRALLAAALFEGAPLFQHAAARRPRNSPERSVRDALERHRSGRSGFPFGRSGDVPPRKKHHPAFQGGRILRHARNRIDRPRASQEQPLSGRFSPLFPFIHSRRVHRAESLDSHPHSLRAPHQEGCAPPRKTSPAGTHVLLCPAPPAHSLRRVQQVRRKAPCVQIVGPCRPRAPWPWRCPASSPSSISPPSTPVN